MQQLKGVNCTFLEILIKNPRMDVLFWSFGGHWYKWKTFCGNSAMRQQLYLILSWVNFNQQCYYRHTWPCGEEEALYLWGLGPHYLQVQIGKEAQQRQSLVSSQGLGAGEMAQRLGALPADPSSVPSSHDEQLTTTHDGSSSLLDSWVTCTHVPNPLPSIYT